MADRRGNRTENKVHLHAHLLFRRQFFVNGTGDDDDDGLGWVGRLVAEARQSGRDVTGYNLGIRGDTSADVAARWRNEARLRLPPEYDGYLAFSFGANDCILNKSDGSPRVGYTESLARAEATLKEARSWLPTMMVSCGSPRRQCSHWRALSRLCEALRADRRTVFRGLPTPSALFRLESGSIGWGRCTSKPGRLCDHCQGCHRLASLA